METQHPQTAVPGNPPAQPYLQDGYQYDQQQFATQNPHPEPQHYAQTVQPGYAQGAYPQGGQYYQHHARRGIPIWAWIAGAAVLVALSGAVLLVVLLTGNRNATTNTGPGGTLPGVGVSGSNNPVVPSSGNTNPMSTANPNINATPSAGSPSDTTVAFFGRIAAHDWNGAMSLWAPNATSVGAADALRQEVESQEAEFNAKITSTQITNSSITPDGNTATIDFIVNLTNGQTTAGRMTLQREGSRWLIIGLGE